MTSDPIVIFGTGRCGSTLINDLLARHDHVAWLSRFNVLFPETPWVNRWFLRAVDLPVIGPRLQDQIGPSEAYPFHRLLHAGIPESLRDLQGHDVLESEVGRIRRAWMANCGGRRHRLLVKFAGWPRVGLVRRVLPEARFLHIVRDGRAVASSLLRMAWWKGWRGPDAWRFGPLSESDRATWEASGRSFTVLAGLQWKICLEAAEAAKASLPAHRVLELRYEDLCAEPSRVIGEVCQFLQLPRTRRFERAWARVDIRPPGDSWRRQLDPRELAHLERAIAEPLRRFGYEVSPAAPQPGAQVPAPEASCNP